MKPEEEKSAIESLNKKLNSKAGTTQEKDMQSPDLSGALPAMKERVRTAWGQGTNKVLDGAEKITGMKKKKTVLRNFLIGAIVFFMISLAFAAYVFVGGLNQVSPENIIISLEGSNNTPAGKVYDFAISIENKNNVLLQDTKMVVAFPDGTKSSINPTLDLKRENISTNEILSGGMINQKLSAILYGDKGEFKNIAVSFEYSVPGSNSTFTKNVTFEVEIDDSPIIVEVDMEEQFMSGEVFETEILISSNTDQTIRDVILVAEYPFGFEYTGSIPEPDFEENIWVIGTIQPTENKRIYLNGKVVGTENDERTIRFNLGIRDSSNQNEIGSLITQKAHTYSIQDPLLQLTASVNGKEGEVIALNMGQEIDVDLALRNNLDVVVENTEIEIQIPNEVIIDESSIRVRQGGFYRSSDRKIVWDRNNFPQLRSIEPGERINLQFSVDTISPANSIALNQRSPLIEITGQATGLNDAGSITSTLRKEIRINSQINVAAQGLYSTGPFINTGPLPPVANSETTYTVTLAVTNRYNSLSGTTLRAVLPGFIEWSNVINPSNENVSYNSNNREIEWNIGRLPAGVGQSSAAKQLSFKISLVPSVSQVGDIVNLVENIRIEAIDDFTNRTISDSTQSVTTFIKNDPAFFIGIGEVTQ